MTFDARKYNQEYMRKRRAYKDWYKAIEKGHCPVCSMLLKSKYHFNCKYLDGRILPPDNPTLPPQ